jgi:hypothetical protein
MQHASWQAQRRQDPPAPPGVGPRIPAMHAWHMGSQPGVPLAALLRTVQPLEWCLLGLGMVQICSWAACCTHIIAPTGAWQTPCLGQGSTSITPAVIMVNKGPMVTGPILHIWTQQHGRGMQTPWVLSCT